MARRNSNGEGSISRRKDGRWEGAVYVLTSSGQRKRLRVYGGTRAEVHDKLVDVKAKQQQGIAVADKSWRLGDYLDYWLETIVRPNRRPTTYERYESIVRLTLKPDLGHLVITRLTVPIMQSYLNRLQVDGKSRRQVQIVREVLSSALTSAMREEIVVRNVARLVVIPSRERASITPWTAKEAIHFLEAARHHRLYPAFALLLLYGLRRGEVLGLRWQDVDFERREMRIEQQISRAGGVVRAGPVKTKAGQRKLPALASIRNLLVAIRGHRSRSDSDLIFTAQASDAPIDPAVITQVFQHICKQNGIRRIKLHHIRHTTATLLKNLGIPARDAQLILGHSHVSTTQQIYQHDDMDSRRQALEQLESIFTTREKRDSPDDEAGSRGFHVDTAVLPSKLPSSLALSINQQENTPSVWGAFYGDLTGNRIRSTPSVASRITEVDQAVTARRRTWFLGVVAVNLAVKNSQASYSPEKEENGPDATPTASIHHH